MKHFPMFLFFRKALLLFFIIVISQTFADVDPYDNSSEENKLNPNYHTKNGSIFVSLGSHCYIALKLRNDGIRNAAFPFDWILSNNGEKLIELIENDFKDFSSDHYLSSFHGVLVQTRYHLQFQHEENGWTAPALDPIRLTKFKNKYARRIERFRALDRYPGTVFFIRVASPESLKEHHAFPNPDNLQLNELYGLRLSQALRKLFPHLNFYVVIMNWDADYHRIDDKQILGNVIMLKSQNVDLVKLAEEFN